MEKEGRDFPTICKLGVGFTLVFKCSTANPRQLKRGMPSLVPRPPPFLFFMLQFALPIFHHSTTFMYYTERKLKNQKWGRSWAQGYGTPGNKAMAKLMCICVFLTLLCCFEASTPLSVVCTHTHTHARMHAHTHTHTHARTHTHTCSQEVMPMRCTQPTVRGRRLE